jgi:hypothetical protein
MAVLKIQTRRPDTRLGHVVEEEWEYDPETGCDTGREHRCVSYRHPDGTYIRRDTHGADAVQEQYKRLVAEHVTINHALKLITDSLPERFKKPVFDSDGNAVSDNSGKSRLIVKDKHRSRYNRIGNGRYKFIVPGIDQATHRQLSAKLAAKFGDSLALLKPVPDKAAL